MFQELQGMMEELTFQGRIVYAFEKRGRTRYVIETEALWEGDIPPRFEIDTSQSRAFVSFDGPPLPAKPEVYAQARAFIRQNLHLLGIGGGA